MRRDRGALAALGAAGALAGLAALSGHGRGSRAADAWRDLEQMTGRGGDLSRHYPQTAAGRMEPGLGEDVFWAGRGYRKIGYIGPTDGTMVPIEARYAEPIEGNIFYPEKLSALVSAIQSGDQPIVEAGYAHLMLIDGGDVEESHEYGDERPWERDDKGALHADVRDGNHRTMAALLAGSDFTWVRLSDATKQDVFRPPKGRERAMAKLYTEIRRAQRAHGAPLLKRPRKRKRSTELVGLEARYNALRAEERRLEQQLLRDLEDLGDGLVYTLAERLERPQTFLRARLARAREQGDTATLRRYERHPTHQRREEVRRMRQDAFDKLWDLRTAAGLDPRNGQPRQ
jgi:hypothetical protein